MSQRRAATSPVLSAVAIFISAAVTILTLRVDVVESFHFHAPAVLSPTRSPCFTRSTLLYYNSNRNSNKNVEAAVASRQTQAKAAVTTPKRQSTRQEETTLTPARSRTPDADSCSHDLSVLARRRERDGGGHGTGGIGGGRNGGEGNGGGGGGRDGRDGGGDSQEDGDLGPGVLLAGGGGLVGALEALKEAIQSIRMPWQKVCVFCIGDKCQFMLLVSGGVWFKLMCASSIPVFVLQQQ